MHHGNKNKFCRPFLISHHPELKCIDSNCDLGETDPATGPGNDEAVMPFISSAGIACGFHAGDPLTIERTIRSAMRHGVNIGAHPGYPDRENFGRKPMMMSPRELRAMILYQAGAVMAMAAAAGARMRHIKPHGALVARSIEGAVLHDTDLMISRVIRMIREKVVETVSGKLIPIEADTVCIHGDNETAPEFVKKLVKALRAEGIILRPLGRE